MDFSSSQKNVGRFCDFLVVIFVETDLFQIFTVSQSLDCLKLACNLTKKRLYQLVHFLQSAIFYTCAFEEVRNVNFTEHFAYVLNA